MSKHRETIGDIKNKVQHNQGKRVRLEAHQSKKKIYQRIGTIEAVYPAIFTITIESSNGMQNQRLSFSYIDLLILLTILSLMWTR